MLPRLKGSWSRVTRKRSEMADGIAGTGGWRGRRRCAVLGGAIGMAFKRAAHQVAGAKTHGQSKRENNAAEEDAKGQLNDVGAQLEVFQYHGGGQYEHQPLDAERKEPRILKLLIDGSDENRTGKETRDESAGDEQHGGPYDAGQVRQQGARKRCGRCVGSIEGRDAYDESEQDAAPERGPGDKRRGRS